jgi:Tfp pilus assembly protein PilF
MSGDSNDSSKHEKARELTEQALDKLVEGQESAADALIDKAKQIDPSGATEVVKDLEEDAADRGEITPKRG